MVTKFDVNGMTLGQMQDALAALPKLQAALESATNLLNSVLGTTAQPVATPFPTVERQFRKEPVAAPTPVPVRAAAPVAAAAPAAPAATTAAAPVKRGPGRPPKNRDAAAAAPAPVALNPDGTPVKRGPGRPRKNPLPVAAAATAAPAAVASAAQIETVVVEPVAAEQAPVEAGTSTAMRLEDTIPADSLQVPDTFIHYSPSTDTVYSSDPKWGGKYRVSDMWTKSEKALVGGKIVSRKQLLTMLGLSEAVQA